MIKFIWNFSHIEVYFDNKFLFSADTMSEARRELDEMGF